MEDKSYKQFVDKLNGYISKYYRFQLIRGFILFILTIILYYSLVAGLEYFSFFDPKVKMLILVTTLILLLFIAFYFLIVPVVKLAGLLKPITYYDVSAQLAKSYPQIKDKLINIIELARDESSNYSDQLKWASIDQKIDELKVFNFSDAIRFRDLKLIFSVLLVIILLFLGAFIKFPDFYTESTVRLIHFQEKFVKPAPFTFHLENKSLEVVSGESLDLVLRCTGRELPQTAFVTISGNNFMMSRDGNQFKYKLENINSPLTFYFTDKKYVSPAYHISVLNKPFISSFKVKVTPPAYTNMSAEILDNIGDLKIASGSVVHWVFNTAYTDSLSFIFNDSLKIPAQLVDGKFELNRTIKHGEDYKIVIKNARLSDGGNLVYRIQTIADLYPEIKVVQLRDSTDFKTFHFKGNLMDDYGFHQLSFVVDADGRDTTFQLPVTPFLLNQDFYYSFDFDQVKTLGKSFKYYFAVFDNDAINHFKRSISETFTFSFPDYKELISRENADLDNTNRLFDKSSKLTEDIRNQIQELKEKQITTKMSDFEKFQMVKDIMDKKGELENVLNQLKQQNKDASNFTNSFTEEKAEILKKQKQIEDLVNEVFDSELKKLFEQFNELAKQFDPNKFEQLSKQMDMRLENLDKQLEKNIELLKRMKVEQKVDRIVDQLKQLSAEEQANLKKIEKRSDVKEIEQLEKKNSELLKDLEKDYKETVEFNRTLEKPMNLFPFDEEFKTVKDNYSKTIEESQRGNKRKASNQIDSNSKALDQLAFAMSQMMANQKEKENRENINNLKQILNNLVYVSFSQENLLNKLSKLDYNNPIVNELKLKQKNLIRQVTFINDSLYALSKRSPEVGAMISKEIISLQTNTESSLENMENGNLGAAGMYDQYGITAANNLALFLSEALENMKKQQNMPGDGDCDKPGGNGSKSGLAKLKQSQQSIKDQLQQMIEEMKSGKTGNLSKMIGQTIAQQEIMQQLLQDMMNGTSIGSGAQQQLRAVEQMLEETRRDLINKNITGDLIKRQNSILSRLLEAEKSEMERGQDDERESKTADDKKGRNPQNYFEYKNKTKNETELAKPSNFKLNNFYDQKYNSFLNRIKE